MSKKNLDLKQTLAAAKLALPKLQHYSYLAFGIFIIVMYGFVILRIQTLSNAPPSDGAIVDQTANARIPRIDPTVLKQLKSLQDNSVSVQTLFEEARNNPFQE